MNEAQLARYYYQRRNFKRKIGNLKTILMEKEEWSTQLLQAIQLNDDCIRFWMTHVEVLRAEMTYKYESGKQFAEKEFKTKLEEADSKMRQLKTLKKTTQKLKIENRALNESILSLTSTIAIKKKTEEKLREEKKLLEDFNNQLSDHYKLHEQEISSLETEVKQLREKNDNISKENRAYDTRLNKLTKKMSSLSKRIADYDEFKFKEMEGKLQDLCTKQETLLPKKKKRKRKPQV